MKFWKKLLNSDTPVMLLAVGIGILVLDCYVFTQTGSFLLRNILIGIAFFVMGLSTVSIFFG